MKGAENISETAFTLRKITKIQKRERKRAQTTKEKTRKIIADRREKRAQIEREKTLKESNEEQEKSSAEGVE